LLIYTHNQKQKTKNKKTKQKKLNKKTTQKSIPIDFNFSTLVHGDPPKHGEQVVAMIIQSSHPNRLFLLVY
jgi:hypothetical protein